MNDAISQNPVIERYSVRRHSSRGGGGVLRRRRSGVGIIVASEFVLSSEIVAVADRIDDVFCEVDPFVLLLGLLRV